MAQETKILIPLSKPDPQVTCDYCGSTNKLTYDSLEDTIKSTLCDHVEIITKNNTIDGVEITLRWTF